MKTTFQELKDHDPCIPRWKKLCKDLNPEMDMTKEITIREILDNNGIKDAYWALRTQSTKINLDIISRIFYFLQITDKINEFEFEGTALGAIYKNATLSKIKIELAWERAAVLLEIVINIHNSNKVVEEEYNHFHQSFGRTTRKSPPIKITNLTEKFK